MNDQVTPSIEPRAASARFAATRALLQRGQHGFARIFVTLERRHRHAVETRDAHDFFDKIGFAFDVAAPTRR